jgi:uncharacterized protein (DUF1499 family)
MKGSTTIYILSLVLVLCGNGCSASRPPGNDTDHERLADCPASPNCVSSDAQDAEHAIAPLILKGDPTTGWEAVVKALDQLPRSKIVEATNRYLHVEYKSRFFRFIDDLELLLNPVTRVIAIRSAARVGKLDFGVNRRRVETLRTKLKEDGLIE